MSDFDYSEYDVATLQNVITCMAWDLKDTKRQIKTLGKRLAGRRGYSHEQLDNMAFHLRGAERLVTTLEIEIEECVSELFRRDGNV